MTTHDLKLHKRWFYDVANGIKTFEIRKDDRDYKVGDSLILREWDENIGYSSFAVLADVTYIIRREDFSAGINEGYCVMGIKVTDVVKTR